MASSRPKTKTTSFSSPTPSAVAPSRAGSSGDAVDVGAEAPANTGSLILSGVETILVPLQAQGILAPGGGGVSSDKPGYKTQTTVVKSETDLTLEYIASNGPGIFLQFGSPAGITQSAGIHILPMYIDELERDLGTDMYLRMLLDAQVKASDATFRSSILAKPLQILPGISEKDKDVPVKQVAFAKNVADFIRANIEGLAQGFSKASYALLEGIALGYKLMEQVYEIRTLIPANGPQTCLKSLDAKPHEAASIVVDKYNHILGYIPRLEGSSLIGNYLFGSLGVLTKEQADVNGTQEIDIPEMVRPEKMVHFVWQGRNDNPVGTSHLRGAYVPWRLKIGLYPAYEAFLARFAQASVAWELDGADLPVSMTDASGNILTSPLQIAQQMLYNLRNYQAGGALLLPVGKLNTLEATAGGAIYLAAFQLCDSQIAMSILNSTLATQGAEFGTQALGTVHQDTQGLMIAYAKDVYANCIREEIVRPLVLYNYGQEGLDVLPIVSFGETEQQDFTATAGGYSSLKAAGLFFPPQFNDMYKKLSITPLDDEVINLLTEQWKAQLAAATVQAQNPMGQPGQPGQPGDPQQAPGGPGATPGGKPAPGQGGKDGKPQDGSPPNPQPDGKYW